MDPPKHTLTPADIMDLRTSCHVRGSADSTNPIGVPFIVYIPSDDAFSLHAEGAVWAQHQDPRVLGAMLRAERAERGFIRRVLSTAEPCDVASLAPDARAAETARRRAEAYRAAQHTQEQAEAAARRANALNVGRLSLEDL